VEEELKKMAPRAQEVIRRIYLEGMKYKDVADKLGISVATVNSILVRTLKKLRQHAENKDELAIYLFFLEKSLISMQ
ncbi:MAG: RNA polymerase sigma factor, partial [Butyricimonas faecihominis]